MAELNGDKIIVFKTPDGEWGEFSNQYQAPFTYIGTRFESVEQFLYYMRALFGRSKATAEKVLECGGDSAALVKISKKQRLLENNSWEEVRQQIMRLGMRQKFLQNPELRKKLLSTGFRLLVEIPKEGLLDRILPPSEEWVRDPAKWKNRNMTGKALMQVRADLRCADRLVGADEAYVFPKAPFILQTPIGKMTLQEIAASTIFKVHPDGLCISANAAGQDVDEELITAVKSRNPEVAVLCNTGCRPDTIIRKLCVADAAVVGTYFKQGGKLENERLENVRVDATRVRMFMDVVREFRTTL